MASVRLKFNVPDPEDDWAALHIYESTIKDGIYNEIEIVTTLGIKPDYITEYTTNQATSVDGWFAIQWEDAKGALSEISNPVQGRTSTLVGQIVPRVLLRDSSIDPMVATQEAEAALYRYLGENPYDSEHDLSYVELRGLTNFTLGMCYLTELAHAAGNSWTAGIVSLKVSDAAVKLRSDSIKGLIASANVDLGLSFSMVAHLKDLEIAGGMADVRVDQSRLLLVELR